MLSAAEQAEVMAVLKGSPLIANWQRFETEYLPHLILRSYSERDILYQPGDAPSHLFVLISGQVVQVAEEEGQAWFRRVIQPAGFFGQHGLFSYEYRTSTHVTSDDTRVLAMPAAAVRVALEQDSTLRETLLRESLASRMRRIPLFRSLADEDVRWIAQVAEEVPLAAGQEAPLAKNPGLWIIDQGQIAVTGPANPFPQVERWRLTSGNFFVASRSDEESESRGLIVMDGLRHGVNCAADTASAHLESVLIYLPLEHAARLMEGKPQVAELMRAPLDIPDVLIRAPLFENLGAERLQHIAQFTAWEFVPAGQNITTQGNAGHSYVILREGAAAVVAYDNQGRERPRNKLLPIAAYGETSLLEGKARDATVRAVQGGAVSGADLLTIDRRDLRYAFDEKPDLWGDELPLVDRSVKEKAPQVALPWMQEGEVLLWKDRPHWLWLAIPMATVIIIFLILLMMLGVTPPDLRPFAGAGVTGVGLILLLIAGVMTYNYLDDYYAVTTRRATRHDRQLFFYDSRQEARGEMIQDVTVGTDFWGRLFDFGDVTIQTASKQGTIRFDNVPHPEAVKVFVQSTRNQSSAAQRGQRREELRRGLISGLHLALPVPQRRRALGDVPVRESGMDRARGLFRRGGSTIRVPKNRSTRPILVRLTRGLPEDMRVKIVGPEKNTQASNAGQLVWRKHWIALAARIWLPLLALIVLLVAGFQALSTQLTRFGITPVQFLLVWLLLVSITGFRLWWVYTDWSNDLYIVTDDRIIDIEMKPLSLNVKRREGGLDRVQNVTAEQRGVLAAIFRYGDVIISTAAANEGFTFNMVPNAKLVQAAVFQKVDAFRARQEEKRLVERRQEIIEGLEVYHQLRGSPEVPPEWREA